MVIEQGHKSVYTPLAGELAAAATATKTVAAARLNIPSDNYNQLRPERNSAPTNGEEHTGVVKINVCMLEYSSSGLSLCCVCTQIGKIAKWPGKC
mmetsp:Transcript_109432/g.189637  ORF Transcript_109432/g.189637 Transcript_109432/m.189637 type:complete len:95 (+) Transcript_109432:557-841(+)